MIEFFCGFVLGGWFGMFIYGLILAGRDDK